MPRARTLLLAITVAGLGCFSAPATAHDGHGSHSHETGVAKASRAMASAARNLWASLSPEQRQKIGFDFNDPLRHDWHVIPRTRKGLPFKEMTGARRALAHALLGTWLYREQRYRLPN